MHKFMVEADEHHPLGALCAEYHTLYLKRMSCFRKKALAKAEEALKSQQARISLAWKEEFPHLPPLSKISTNAGTGEVFLVFYVSPIYGGKTDV